MATARSARLTILITRKNIRSTCPGIGITPLHGVTGKHTACFSPHRYPALMKRAIAVKTAE